MLSVWQMGMKKLTRLSSLIELLFLRKGPTPKTPATGISIRSAIFYSVGSIVSWTVDWFVPTRT